MTGLNIVFEPPIARLILTNPTRRNALTAEMWDIIPEICAEIEDCKNALVVIVEGAGDHFCAGADIAEFDTVFSDLSSSRRYLTAIENGLRALATIDRPSIAKLKGSVFGGGLALALACDVRLASEKVRMSAPPAKLGLVYGSMETRLLIEAVGPAIAKEMLFSGKILDAAEAWRLGLVSGCFSEDELDFECVARANDWAKLSQTSIRSAKKAIQAVLDSDFTKPKEMAVAAAMSEDFHEGRTAFVERRHPQFVSGRRRC